MEIGNENGGTAYQERYALFYDAIKAKYPQMHLVANEWRGTPTNRPVEIVDEHYYSTPEFFIANAGKYDTYDRAGRKVYVGEYAVTQGCGQGNLRAALGEAAFMTGMERNSDVVVMASYAPLFANVNYKKWNPDLIDFDSSRAYGMPSYYVQQMFSENRGDVVLPVTVTAPEVAPAAQIRRDRRRHLAHAGRVQGPQGHARRRNALRVRFRRRHAKAGRLRGGEWAAEDGALQQKALAENIRAFAGDKGWNNYTYSLKARKLGGAEGFLIPFLVKDEEAKAWWNIGGWGNTRHAIEMDGNRGNDVPGSIETGRWYDIRIEVQGREHQMLPRRQADPRREAGRRRSRFTPSPAGQARERGDPQGRERFGGGPGNGPPAGGSASPPDRHGHCARRGQTRRREHVEATHQGQARNV